jgi:ribosomal protein S18 acetylase RimI-like enzyme
VYVTHPPIERLDLADPQVAMEILAVQRAAYAVEAELIGSGAIPPLHETLEELQATTERFLGIRDDDGLAAVVSWHRHPDGTLDVCRLAVAPRAFRRGYASALLDAVDEREPARRTVVSTGAANAPALSLYKQRGFVEVGTVEVEPGLKVTNLERTFTDRND